MSLQPIEFYEFGPFRLDVAERLLLRAGVTIQVTPKAFELLLVLVSHHGHLLGKDELMKTIWPDAFVEEGNLSWNISQLRKALGDGEDGIHYIETVPRRGYRFIAAVLEKVDEGNEPAVAVHAEPDVIKDNPPTTQPPPQSRPVSRFWRAAVSVALVMVIGVSFWLTAFQPPPSWQPPRIVPFTVFQGNERQPSFSPDGNQIAFSWDGEKEDNQDIYIKQIGNELPLRLTTNSAADTWPCWSPDGRYIAFTREQPEGTELYLIPSLGGPERRITRLVSPGGAHYLKSWSPNGQWLAFTDRGNIFLVAPENDDRRRLTTTPVGASGDLTPAISPDGKTVAFFRGFDLYLVPITGGEPKLLVSNTTLSWDPAWTPDGREIIFISARSGTSAFGLWRVSAAGGTPLRIEAAGQNVGSFAVSRDGQRLAWTQTIGGDDNIWRIELGDGSTPSSQASQSPRSLISSTRTEAGPQISPDGNRIAFQSDRSGSYEIWVADSDGRNPQRLTFFNRSLTGSAHWSPNGKQIVFDSRAEGRGDIYIISAEGGNPRRLTTDPNEDAAPSWSRDGKSIYFCSTRSGSHRIWKMPAAGGQAVMITKQGDGGHECVESPNGQFLYYQKLRLVPGIWRVPVDGGDETLILDHHRAGFWRHWTVVEEGIYFATAERPEQPLIEFFSFATGRVTYVATLQQRIDPWSPGLAVSRDGRWMVWSQKDKDSNDIMLMENFR
jgi:Tol biopolymer transport system component/DNA-binding winged helix-turn-helix (wHTH) protein